MTTRDKLEYQKRLRFLRESKAKTASEQLKLAKSAEESDLTKPMVTLGDKENRVPVRGETPKEYNETPKTGEESLYKEPVEGGDKKEKKIELDLDLMDVVQLKEATPPQEDAKQSRDRRKDRNKENRNITDKRSHEQKMEEHKNVSLFDVLRECGCEMESPFDAPEDEPQGYMLKQSLEKIGSQATDLSNVAKHDDDPEPWVEFKVTSAAEQIDAVHDYIKYGRKHRSDMSGEMNSHHEEMMNEDIMNIKESELRNMIREAVKTKLQEFSSYNKEELPGSGDMPALMKKFDDLLLDFSKKALDLHAEMVEEMKVDMLGGTAAPQMSPRIGERNRMLTVRAGMLRKLAANCTAAIEACRREG